MTVGARQPARPATGAGRARQHNPTGARGFPPPRRTRSTSAPRARPGRRSLGESGGPAEGPAPPLPTVPPAPTPRADGRPPKVFKPPRRDALGTWTGRRAREAGHRLDAGPGGPVPPADAPRGRGAAAPAATPQGAGKRTTGRTRSPGDPARGGANSSQAGGAGSAAAAAAVAAASPREPRGGAPRAAGRHGRRRHRRTPPSRTRHGSRPAGAAAADRAPEDSAA